MLGTRCGKWLFVADAGRYGRHRKWLVRCDCGTERTVYRQNLNPNGCRSCLPTAPRRGVPRRERLQYAGQRFGRWFVLSDLPGSTQRRVVARCDCGSEKTVHIGNLISGMSRSCGCLTVETCRARATTHGKSGTAIYNVWQGMIARCQRVGDARWVDYGGRGITVCERWQTFENFYADMGDKPTGRSLDRIDNDGNYEPGNCRWATQKEQCSNTRRNVWLTWQGRTMHASDWAKELGVSRQRIEQRLRRFGENSPHTFARRGEFTPVARPKAKQAPKLTRVNGKNACGVCGERGHNRQTCANQIRQVAA